MGQGVPNRSQVFQIVVECLRAICLYQPALDMIMQSGVIQCLIRCFANPNYSNSLSQEAAGFFAKKMEELLRHNPRLQPFGIRAIVSTLKQLRNKPYLEANHIQNNKEYPLFPEKYKDLIIYPEEPCFTGDAEAFWSAVTNIGKFLESSLKKFTQWEFVKNGGMDALVQLSYDPIMHSVATMKAANNLNNLNKYGTASIPATNPKMTTA